MFPKSTVRDGGPCSARSNLDDFLSQDPVLNRFNGRNAQPPSKKKAKKAETSASSITSSSKKSNNPLSDFLSQDTVLSQAISSDESDNENGNNEGSKTSNKKRKRSTEYVPKAGSGGYAILLALYMDEISDDPKDYFTKTELCKGEFFLEVKIALVVISHI